MRPYPRYRDSGVEWLGELPEHWDVRPFKSVLARNEGGVWGDDPRERGGNDRPTLDGADSRRGMVDR